MHGSTNPLKILVLAHDLSDAAIERRIHMLREGGAEIAVAGFRRTGKPVGEIAGFPATDLGRTYNRGFAQRVLSILHQVFSVKKHGKLFRDADVILARNLEMLAIAVRGRSACNPGAVIVYECLDIHSLLLRKDLIGVTLRSLEGWLAKRASALITSSPAFVSNYYQKLARVKLPVKLVENKVPDMNGSLAAASAPSDAPAWVIGWFGILRCKKSLHTLAELVRKSGGKVQVILRGKPALDQLDDFHDVIATTPGMRFFGPYQSPDDLAVIYGSPHFTWAIDMYEEGLNSSWLLPNRLYEGGAFGAVPLALESVETGRFLERLGIGITLRQPLLDTLVDTFNNMTQDRYQKLRNASLQIPRSTWTCSRAECVELVDYLRSLAGNGKNV